MLFTLLDGPVPPGAAVLDTLQDTLAVQDVHHRHDGRVRDRAVVPEPLPDLAHHARALGGPHHVHDGHLKFTELAHLAAPPFVHVSTEDALSGVLQPVQGRKAAPRYWFVRPGRRTSTALGYRCRVLRPPADGGGCAAAPGVKSISPGRGGCRAR